MDEVVGDPLAGLEPAPRPRASRGERLLVRGFVVLAILAVLVSLGLLASLAWGHHRLQQQLQAIRERGEPVLPEDMTWPAPGPGEDPWTWMRALTELEYENFSVEELPSCAASGRSTDDVDWFGFHATLADPLRAESLDACDRAYLRRDLEAERAVLELALRVEGLARLDPRPLLDGDRRDLDSIVAGSAPREGIQGCIRSSEVLSHAAFAAALDGNGERAIELARHALRAAALLDDLPSVLTLLASNLANRIAMTEGILPLLHILPAGSDLIPVEHDLEALDPRAQQAFAFIGERLFGNRIYRWMRDEQGALGGLMLASSWHARVVRAALDHDQANYLRELAFAVNASHRPFWDPAWRVVGPEAVSERNPFRYYNVVSLMILPHLESVGVATAELEARCLLTRGAIRARRDGAQAAGEWITTQTDPFTGQPLRWRLGDDGLMVLWSVGRNLVDDGGTLGDPDEPPLDEVVRVRPR